MLFIKELKKDEDLSVIESVYDKGNKIALSFNKDTLVGYENTVCYDDEYKSNKLKDEYIVKNGAIYIKACKIVVIDKIQRDTSGVLAYIYPYEDTSLLTYFLYDDDGVIADSVAEVSIN